MMDMVTQPLTEEIIPTLKLPVMARQLEYTDSNVPERVVIFKIVNEMPQWRRYNVRHVHINSDKVNKCEMVFGHRNIFEIIVGKKVPMKYVKMYERFIVDEVLEEL
jgi:hypothetical protein